MEQRGFFVKLQEKRSVPQVSVLDLEYERNDLPHRRLWENFERYDRTGYYNISDFPRLLQRYPDMFGITGRRPQIHPSYRNLVEQTARNTTWNRRSHAVAAYQAVREPLPENVFTNAPAESRRRRRKTRRNRRK
jgi:hypothetical protein